MEADPSLLSLNVGLGVLLTDVLLSGDNAMVIALVCRSLSPAHRTRALWLGILGAFLVRLVLTSVANVAMNLPFIKLIGGLLLLKIAMDLMVDNADPNGLPIDAQSSPAQDVLAAAKTIVLADVVMSLDNVVALSAITQNNMPMLVAGLLLSIPILMFGSLYISRLLVVFPYLVWVGAAMLGGVAGALVIDDPVFNGYFNNASSMAPLAVPLLSAVFVVQMGRLIGRNLRAMAAMPKPPKVFDILWNTAPADARSVPPTAPVVAAVPAPVASPALTRTVQTAPPRATAAPRGDHRVVMGLGLFMMVTGGVAYYMLNVYQPAVPDTFLTYFCKAPAMSVNFRPSANQIRFATPKGSVVAAVIEGRIVWEDYRESSARLAIAPPVKIITADVERLVVHGGNFENATCLALTPRSANQP